MPEGRHWFETKWTYTGTRRKRYRYERWREWDENGCVKRSRYVGVDADAPPDVPVALDVDVPVVRWTGETAPE